MKEYKTLKVRPYDESDTIQFWNSFGWKLEETREVYNESQEIVGQTYTANNSFMHGFTGKDGNIEVQTRTNVTHFLSMRFSRDTSMKNYARIAALQEEYDNLEYKPHEKAPDSPFALIVMGVVGFFTIILPIIAIRGIVKYPKEKARVAEVNAQIDKENELIKQRYIQIIKESRSLVEESGIL